ncbi:MAG TPA: metallophosphoesterase family protein [Candidatus Krumholzibacteria bacterium]|nr:metallophosphoesterase family protein [Candidatus Krumholzibacteria bacterium]
MRRTEAPSTALLAWASDIHLDHAGPARMRAFLAELAAAGADRVLLGGDISLGPRVLDDVQAIAQATGRPVHFVMGNHDYWDWSVDAARAALAKLRGPGVAWLPASGCVEVAEGVGLVGHGGWGDARHGDLLASDVILNDYIHIAELAETIVHHGNDWYLEDQAPLVARLRALGEEAAAGLEADLHTAASLYTQVVVLTHVPPFPEAALRDGRPLPAAWLHGYVCGATGQALERTARSRRGTMFTVLCGHTHGEATAWIRPNLVVHNSDAAYGQPRCRLVEASRAGVTVVDAPVDAAVRA